MSKNLGIRFVVVIIVIIFPLISCIGMLRAQAASNELYGKEFSPNIVSEMTKLSNGKVHYLTKSRFENIDSDKYKIIAFEVSYEKRLDILKKVTSKYKNTKYQFFYTQLSIDKSPELVCILKSEDKYDILRAFLTNGTNYDIDTEAIIKKLKEWDKKYGIEIIGADGDWVEVKFERLPQDTRKFAEEVYTFCPDAVEQDAGSIEALESNIKAYKRVFLWWD